jgi:predicted MFS family arabinose efflux permease
MAMAVATFPLTIFSVLAADLIEEFDVSRAQLGFLVTSTGLVGALVSPYFGQLTDRLGAVSATRWVLSLGIVAHVALAVSPVYAILIGAALLSGLPNGWTNPATNALIVDNLPSGKRGVVTGVKQSGVQIGVFLGGLLLPLFASLWNWRVAIAIFIIIPASGLIGMWGRKDRQEPHHYEEDWIDARLPASIKWIAVYGAVSGTATSAMFGFIPLFAEEDQLWSAQAAGTLMAIVGIIGVIARIIWPSVSERRLGHGPTLRVLALLSLVSAVLLAMAAMGAAPSWVLVPASILIGGGAIAWNAVGMLAVMDLAPPGMVGKGTGIVLLGFLGGVAVGAPLLGLSVDLWQTYAAGWFAVAALLFACALIAGRIPRGSSLAAS